MNQTRRHVAVSHSSAGAHAKRTHDAPKGIATAVPFTMFIRDDGSGSVWRQDTEYPLEHHQEVLHDHEHQQRSNGSKGRNQSLQRTCKVHVIVGGGGGQVNDGAVADHCQQAEELHDGKPHPDVSRKLRKASAAGEKLVRVKPNLHDVGGKCCGSSKGKSGAKHGDVAVIIHTRTQDKRCRTCEIHCSDSGRCCVGGDGVARTQTESQAAGTHQSSEANDLSPLQRTFCVASRACGTWRSMSKAGSFALHDAWYVHRQIKAHARLLEPR